MSPEVEKIHEFSQNKLFQNGFFNEFSLPAQQLHRIVITTNNKKSLSIFEFYPYLIIFGKIKTKILEKMISTQTKHEDFFKNQS